MINMIYDSLRPKFHDANGAYYVGNHMEKLIQNAEDALVTLHDQGKLDFADVSKHVKELTNQDPDEYLYTTILRDLRRLKASFSMYLSDENVDPGEDSTSLAYNSMPQGAKARSLMMDYANTINGVWQASGAKNVDETDGERDVYHMVRGTNQLSYGGKGAVLFINPAQYDIGFARRGELTREYDLTGYYTRAIPSVLIPEHESMFVGYLVQSVVSSTVRDLISTADAHETASKAIGLAAIGVAAVSLLTFTGIGAIVAGLGWVVSRLFANSADEKRKTIKDICPPQHKIFNCYHDGLLARNSSLGQEAGPVIKQYDMTNFMKSRQAVVEWHQTFQGTIETSPDIHEMGAWKHRMFFQPNQRRYQDDRENQMVVDMSIVPISVNPTDDSIQDWKDRDGKGTESLEYYYDAEMFSLCCMSALHGTTPLALPLQVETPRTSRNSDGKIESLQIATLATIFGDSKAWSCAHGFTDAFYEKQDTNPQSVDEDLFGRDIVKTMKIRRKIVLKDGKEL